MSDRDTDGALVVEDVYYCRQCKKGVAVRFMSDVINGIAVPYRVTVEVRGNCREYGAQIVYVQEVIHLQ